MTKYRLFRRRRILGPDDQAYLDRWPLALTPWGRVYLHRFHAPDPACLHDHPWSFWSLVLWGGYWETTETGTTYRGIGSLAYRPASWTHRVARLHPRRTTWTLVVTGPTVRMWGFFTPSGWVEFWRTDRRGEC